MYTDEEFEKLEQEERELTDEAILAMLLILANIKGNLENELRKFYQQYGRDGVVTYAEARKWVSEQDHRRRLTALTIYLSGEFTSALADMEAEFARMLKLVIEKETGFFDVSIDDEKILLLAWGEDFATWLKRLEDNVNLWNVRILYDIKRALLKGKSLNEVLKQLDKRFISMDAVVKKLGLTESTAIGSLARKEIFQELGVSKYRFYTKADERTCEVCGSMHGLVFPMSAYEVGSTASPLHPHCRCWEVPIVD